MHRRLAVTFLVLSLCAATFAQTRSDSSRDEQPIRISTELVQLDVVVIDGSGRVVRGLTRDDFEITDGGRKQQISFFEFVDTRVAPEGKAVQPGDDTEADIKRTFAFVVDDLTIRGADLVLVRQLLTRFVDERMQPGDLVSITRVIGGRSLLHQFTTDKDLLRRAIASLTVRTHPTNLFESPIADRQLGTPIPAADSGGPVLQAELTAEEVGGEAMDILSQNDDTNVMLRAFMTLGTASFAIDGMRELPGRKSLVLISGGLPIFSPEMSRRLTNVSAFVNELTDRATRASVSIHTFDVRGLGAQAGVASFTDTPGRSAMPSTLGELRGTSDRASFGRTGDDKLLGSSNPFDSVGAHMGLRILSSATGGLSILNKNDFDKGLDQILDANEGYYLLAYTPADVKFDGSFRKVDIKVRGSGLKVHSRQGYVARAESARSGPKDTRERILTAIKAPLARREINLEALLLYKGQPPDKGDIDVHLLIDPNTLEYTHEGGNRNTSFDVAGFVFDELGKLRGGFSETINASLTEEEFERVRSGGLTYTANTTLSPGIYQLRLAVSDNKSGRIGTVSRYLEIPNLSQGKLAMSSLWLSAVDLNDSKNLMLVTSDRRIARKHDLQYAVMIYNPKLKGGKTNVTTQMIITMNGQEIFRQPEQPLEPNERTGGHLARYGQLRLAAVQPGSYTLTLIVTDHNADKRSQLATRSADFVVID